MSILYVKHLHSVGSQVDSAPGTVAAFPAGSGWDPGRLAGRQVTWADLGISELHVLYRARTEVPTSEVMGSFHVS